MLRSVIPLLLLTQGKSTERQCAKFQLRILSREIKDLSVLGIDTAALSSHGCKFVLGSCNQKKSNDVFEIYNNNDGPIELSVFSTKLPETPSASLMQVLSISTRIPVGEEIDAEDLPLLYMHVVRSSAWVGVELEEEQKNEFEADFSSYPMVSKVKKYYKELLNTWTCFEDLLASHVTAWEALHSSGIEIKGNDTIAAAINASMYYILSAVDKTSLWSVSPGGLTKNSYNGHVFWDCETWILPALVPLFPDIAIAFGAYRTSETRLKAARSRAAARGYSGAMMPFESAVTGMDVTPTGNEEGEHEIHVTADVSLALRSIYYWTGNTSWFNSAPWELVEACCEYLVSRVSCVKEDVISAISNSNITVFRAQEAKTDHVLAAAKRMHVDLECSSYTYLDVMAPDEKAGVVNSSVYTNAAAAELLRWAAAYAQKQPQLQKIENDIEETTTISEAEGIPLVWRHIADQMSIPLSSSLYKGGMVHPEYDGYNNQPINQADAVLLQFPLQWSMPDTLAFNDLQYYANLTSIPGETKGYYTGDSSYSIAYLALWRSGFNPVPMAAKIVMGTEESSKDDGINSKYRDIDINENNDQSSFLLQLAHEQFATAFEHMDLDAFGVWHETKDGGHINFITGAGGFLQNILYGYCGMAITEESLLIKQPILPPGDGVTGVTLRGVNYKSCVLTISYEQAYVTVTVLSGQVQIKDEYEDADGSAFSVSAEESYSTAIRSGLVLTITTI